MDFIIIIGNGANISNGSDIRNTGVVQLVFVADFVIVG